MSKHKRTAIAALALSASVFVALVVEEGYVRKAEVPTKNDRCTNGYGGTFNEDGTAVQCGETIEPVPALQRSMKHIQKDEDRLKQCVTGPMYQAEYDILVGFAYQYGTKATCGSSMVKYVNAGNYVAACNAYTLYRRSGPDKYDCSTLINGKPNKRCWGVWTRNLERRASCLKAGA